MNPGLLCPVCGTPAADPGSLAEHLVARAGTSDAGHIMWMNRNVTKLALPASELEPLLVSTLAGEPHAGARITR